MTSPNCWTTWKIPACPRRLTPIALDELNPYAVEMRYGLIEPSGLDRTATACWVKDVIYWAGALLDTDKRQSRES